MWCQVAEVPSPDQCPQGSSAGRADRVHWPHGTWEDHPPGGAIAGPLLTGGVSVVHCMGLSCHGAGNFRGVLLFVIFVDHLSFTKSFSHKSYLYACTMQQLTATSSMKASGVRTSHEFLSEVLWLVFYARRNYLLYG